MKYAFLPSPPHPLGNPPMLECGPVMEMALFPSGEKRWHLLLASGHWIDVDIEHLLENGQRVPAVSWSVLLRTDSSYAGGIELSQQDPLDA